MCAHPVLVLLLRDLLSTTTGGQAVGMGDLF